MEWGILIDMVNQSQDAEKLKVSVIPVHKEIHCMKCGLIFESMKGFQQHLPTCKKHKLSEEELKKLEARKKLIHTQDFFIEKMQDKLNRDIVNKYKKDIKND